MQKVLTASEMREVDRLTTERHGIASIDLMENAAGAVASTIAAKLGRSVEGRSILILCGKGNNGGDGTALARLLHSGGGIVEVYIFGSIDGLKGDAKINAERLRKIADDLDEADKRLHFEEVSSVEGHLDFGAYTSKNFDVVVDALFGTGLTRPLDPAYEDLFKIFSRKESGWFRVSIDVPSGLFSDSREVPDFHFTSDVTVTFTVPKVANVLPPAVGFNGEVVVAEIGSPADLVDEQPSQTFLVERDDVARWLDSSKFSDSSYKNKRGHCFVIAGSEDYSGAAVLAANAAMRSGVGIVTLSCPADAKTDIASRLLPEVILTSLDSEAFHNLAAKADAVGIGCGLSANDPAIETLVREAVAKRITPIIVDAGALGFFAPPCGIPAAVGGQPPLILTPHEGEFLRLLGAEDRNALADRISAVRRFAVQNNVILVLKGERVLIGEPGGKVLINPTGNSGLGKAGNGDTLTGIISGFVAQAAVFEIDVFETVAAAVYLAGTAGDIAEEKYGKRVMTASDVRECLAEAFERLGA